MLKPLLLISTLLFVQPAFSADYLDTQYGSDGLEVHLKKVSLNHSILTVVIELENTGDQKFKYMSLPVSQVYYNTKDKKYPVVKDTEGKWLASTVAYGRFTDHSIFIDQTNLSKNSMFEIGAGKKKIAWMKFEAPQESDWPLELNMIGISPFTINKPE